MKGIEEILKILNPSEVINVLKAEVYKDLIFEIQLFHIYFTAAIIADI